MRRDVAICRRLIRESGLCQVSSSWICRRTVVGADVSGKSILRAMYSGGLLLHSSSGESLHGTRLPLSSTRRPSMTFLSRRVDYLRSHVKNRSARAVSETGVAHDPYWIHACGTHRTPGSRRRAYAYKHAFPLRAFPEGRNDSQGHQGEREDGSLTGMEVKRWLLLSMAYEGRRGYMNATGSNMLFSDFLVQCLIALDQVTKTTNILKSSKRQELNHKVVRFLGVARKYPQLSTSRRQQLCEDVAHLFGERETFVSATRPGVSPDIAIATAGTKKAVLAF